MHSINGRLSTADQPVNENHLLNTYNCAGWDVTYRSPAPGSEDPFCGFIFKERSVD